MSMMISCTCDGCDAYVETSVGIEDGANAIEAAQEDGWVNTDSENYCPACVAAGYADG